MAGYIFSLDNLESLTLYTQNGVYATKLSPPRGNWGPHHEGTFADYSTMRAGDNIYFFIRRRIYGIGRLIRVGQDCKYFNYPSAGQPSSFKYESVQGGLLWDEGEDSVKQRCVCFFEPDPHFFRQGVDMDDVLASNPAAFKMLRAFWKLSFIKFDDEENQAFRDIILKRNQHALSKANSESFFEHVPVHVQIAEKLSAADYSMATGIASVVSGSTSGDRLRHEMAIEMGILHQLATKDPKTCILLGEWDYLSHQVIASPFKPIDYMDKMDLFGYAYVLGFKPTKSRFLVGEIKKDTATIEDVDQLLKYVDWVRDEYCFGDYSMIRAFLIAYDFDTSVKEHARNVGVRRYTVGVRPTRSAEWNEVRLIKYWYNPELKRISLEEQT